MYAIITYVNGQFFRYDDLDLQHPYELLHRDHSIAFIDVYNLDGSFNHRFERGR